MLGSPIKDEINDHTPNEQEQSGEKQRVDAQQDKHTDDTHPSGALEYKEKGRGHDESKSNGEHPVSWLRCRAWV
jgi:hypothetical protein